MRVRTAVAVGGLAAAGAAAWAWTTVRPWWQTWGVDPSEVGRELPGDDLVEDPTAVDTRGITIDAPPGEVWPWLVQMGYGRAGWYSYDAMDMRGQSLDRIAPEFQALAVGDVVPTHPGGGFLAKIVEPERALVLYSDPTTMTPQGDAAGAPGGATEPMPANLRAGGAVLGSTMGEFAASWAFVLEPADGGRRTRLIERFRVRFTAPPGPAGRASSTALGFGVFVMARRQMIGIRERAERAMERGIRDAREAIGGEA